MSPRPNPLATAVRCGLVLAMLPLAAAAQEDASTPSTRTLDTVQVTGSRIRRADLETQVPVQILTREDIDRSGFTSVADLVQNLTASGAALNTRFNSSGNFGFPPDGGGVGAGAATVDLRHLGAKRVLVLVDGIRWVNESSASGVGSAVDLNTIPLAIIERIEVLEDGASSIYGSDAIAGVVNIITRKEVDGPSVQLHYGDYSDLAGGETWGADLGWGGSSDRARWFVGASYFKQKEISSLEYGPASEPVPGTGLSNGSSATPQGRFVFQDPNTGIVYDITPDAGATAPTYAGGLPGCPTDRADDFHCFGTADRFNFAPYNLLLTPSERKSVFGQVQFDFSPTFGAYARVLYNERESANQAAPEPIFLGTDAGVYNEWAETRLVISAANPYNPFGFDLTTVGPDANLFLLGRRPVEGGPRRYVQEVETWYAAFGLNGLFDVGGRQWSWDVNLVRSESDAGQTNTGSYNVRRINEALGDPAACAAIAGCVPLDLFGGPGTITPEMLAFIQPVVHDRSSNELSVASANLTGDLFDGWAGTVAFAAGLEYRKYEGEYQPDPITVAGEYNGVPSGATRGKYDVREAYAELLVPLARDGWLGKSLDLSLAGRWSDYSNFGGTSTGKLGLRWQVADELLLRGSFAEGFRAPSIGELYGTLSRFDATLVDPCNNEASTTPQCVADGVPPGYEQTNPQISVVTSGNIDLQPETSRSLMLGAVWSPSFADDAAWSDALDLGLTFYRHTIDGAIQALDAQTILDRCVGTRDPVSCGFYERNERGQIVRFDNILGNVGTIRTDGWDFSADWRLPERAWGHLAFAWKTTWVTKYELVNEAGQAEPRAPGVEINNSAIPERTSTLAAVWRGPGGWQAAWTARYIDRLRESCGGANGFDICDDSVADRNDLGSTTYHDAQLSWAGDARAKDFRVTLGVNNVFAKDPPICLSCTLNGYDASTYDLPGRFWYARVGFGF
ncbi:iron complex outermembrane receptor protein [Luteimonas sp. J16]|jgi:iron complex outermembrane receptor protein|uniref:TonB-dependent receptor plug domain-containing protein n=1 Tax=unclassified Luteimonas TaxID=2629088 RepID=UPI0005C1E53A|nr:MULTISPECIES: TonB-dependent receptor [unclassified Luteimonas]TWG92178.1 iron complex outermembrane receptor protein [Luteimonas sp. J16]